MMVRESSSALLMVLEDAAAVQKRQAWPVKLIRENAFLLGNGNSCVEDLRKMDEAIAKDSIAGETTCAFAIVIPEEIIGASVGDSGVWWIPENGNHLNLTPTPSSANLSLVLAMRGQFHFTI